MFFVLKLACNKTLHYSVVLEINFAEPDYAFVEGSELSCLPIVLLFRKSQNPFTVKISPVTIDRAESQDLGIFIHADTVTPDTRATTGQLHMAANHYYVLAEFDIFKFGMNCAF